MKKQTFQVQVAVTIEADPDRWTPEQVQTWAEGLVQEGFNRRVESEDNDLYWADYGIRTVG